MCMTKQADKKMPWPKPAGFTLSPAVAALSMSGSSIIVAVNAIALKRLRLPNGPKLPPNQNDRVDAASVLAA